MPEASLVPEFLKDFALKRNFAVHDCVYGSINLGRSFPIEQSCGAVYGIWASSLHPSGPASLPYPATLSGIRFYWGKDITPVSRLKAHVQGHQNGNINLPSIPELENLPWSLVPFCCPL